MSFTVRGEAAANSGLKNLANNFRRGVLGGGYAATAIIVRTAQQGILNGNKSGRVYTTFFRSGRGGGVFPVGQRSPHQASAAGEYSASDTGKLAASVGGSNSFLQMRVWANAPYAGFQEEGTAKMRARPNIGNAVRDSEPMVTALIGHFVWRAIR